MEPFTSSEKRFELHLNLSSHRYAWFCGDRRESDWFGSKRGALGWTGPPLSWFETQAKLAAILGQVNRGGSR